MSATLALAWLTIQSPYLSGGFLALPERLGAASVMDNTPSDGSTITVGSECNGWKMEITFFPDRGSNPVRWTQSPTLYHVAIKPSLYRKAVQEYHIPISGDILPLQLEIHPWISRSLRIMWNETQGVFCTRGLFMVGAKCNRWKMEITFSPDPGSNPVRWTHTLYRIAIKTGLYPKAVQVYHIPIPGDINFIFPTSLCNSKVCGDR